MRGDREFVKSLLLEKITGVISDEDNRVLEEILIQDDEARSLWIDLCARMHSPQGQAFRQNLNENTAWEKIQHKIKPEEKMVFLLGPKVRRIYWSAAAVLIVAFALGLYNSKILSRDQIETHHGVQLLLSDGKTITLDENIDNEIDLGTVMLAPGKESLSFSSNQSASLEWTTLVVPLTKTYKIELSDGSEVWMNASSSLRFPFNFSDSVREVYLTGEGYFDVTKNIDQPFLVHAGNTTIRVLGTSFNVNAYNDTLVATALVEGSVMAKAGDYKILLEPGYQTFAKSKAPFVTEPFDHDLVLSWMEGTYHFHNQSLIEISQVMKRWFNITVIFENPEAPSLKFTGTIYKNQGLDIFISNLELSSNIRATLSRDTLFLQ